MIYRMNKHSENRFSIGMFDIQNERWLPIESNGYSFEQYRKLLESLGFIVVDDYQLGEVRQIIYVLCD